MKKYYLKGTDLELPVKGCVVLEVSTLLDAGHIDVKEVLTINSIIEHLAKRINITKGNAEVFLRTLCVANKKALFLLLLKEAALLLDDNYEGHIKYSDEIWVVENNVNKPLLLAKLKSGQEMHDIPFNVIAAFRCKEDTELALNVLKHVIDSMNGK